MPFRMIKDTIRSSKNVCSLTDFQFRVWVYLITYVDDYGRGSADPELLKGLLFPRSKETDQLEDRIKDALDTLAVKGMITIYDFEGEPYLYFPKWKDHQRVRSKVSKFPTPPPECGELRRVAADCGELPQDAARNLNLNLNLNQEPKPEPEPEPEPHAREEPQNDLARVMQFYMDNVNAIPSPYCVDMLKVYTESLGAELVLHAIQVALDEQKASFGYIRAILQRYEREHFQTVEEAVQSEKSFRKGNGGKTDNIFLQMYKEEFE